MIVFVVFLIKVMEEVFCFDEVVVVNLIFLVVGLQFECFGQQQCDELDVVVGEMVLLCFECEKVFVVDVFECCDLLMVEIDVFC